MDRILVADDDPALRGLMRLVARRSGFAVDIAANGKDALDKIQENDYLIVVVDLMMPIMNGYEVIERLAGMPDRPGVVVVTATTDTYIQQLNGDVVQSIVRKPFDIEMLRGVLTELARALRESARPANVVDIRHRIS
ncbi:MAG TPA: response regulator [Thermoanaerobaculia bacterium]|nr:response regulator [Thermoanaerobaculia bacterium]